ncbi:MAG: glycosyltransferase family 1 protein [Planctomycetaceae bacterium]|nr:glycosyltransferase family 1 protein [Planctomycetaceae bacterium]
MTTEFQDVDQPRRSLRVVHAANYQMDKDGLAFFNPDQKMHQGLVQAGCYVYPFSINDRARMLSPTGSKIFGRGRANRALIQTCVNVNPDLLVLCHAQTVTRETIIEIRRKVPGIRIAFWYVDPIWEGCNYGHLTDRQDLFDAIFCTTGGRDLKQFCNPGCPAAFIPNPVEAGIERDRAFEDPNPEYDLVFFGRDKYAPDRREFLSKLVAALPEFRMGIFGSLGNPLVFGHAKEHILATSRMALNLSRRDDVELYSSDRIAQLTGNGILTLTAAGGGLEQLYTSDEVVYYSGFDDLVVKLRQLKQNDAERVRIARNGWVKSHTVYSARQVARFIVDLSMRYPEYRQCPWGKHVYWHESDRDASLTRAAA